MGFLFGDIMRLFNQLEFIQFFNYLKNRGKLLPNVNPIEVWGDINIKRFIINNVISQTALCRLLDSEFDFDWKESGELLENFLEEEEV
jgi:hypothetical protein